MILPDLKGTPKQIVWAENIRQQKLESLVQLENMSDILCVEASGIRSTLEWMLGLKGFEISKIKGSVNDGHIEGSIVPYNAELIQLAHAYIESEASAKAWIDRM